MCKCTPNIRTPFCGKVGCEWPGKKPEGARVSPDSNVEKNREMLLQRSIVGLAKYGVTTDNNPLSLRAWLQHALEEALDMANYLQAAISKLDEEEGKANDNGKAG